MDHVPETLGPPQQPVVGDGVAGPPVPVPVPFTDTQRPDQFFVCLHGCLPNLETLIPRADDLGEDVLERLRNLPVRIVPLQPAQVADVADMVAFAVRLLILIAHLLSGEVGDPVEGFEDGAGVVPAAAKVVDLAASRALIDGFNGAGDVVTMNIVADLLALVAVNAVGPSLH